MSKPRRRQANGRPNRVRINITGDQMSRWRDLAASDQVTLPRWVVEQVENKPPTMIRRAVRSEVNGIRMEIRGAMANLNQLAHHANIEGLDLPGWDDTVREIERQGELLNRLIEHLA